MIKILLDVPGTRRQPATMEHGLLSATTLPASPVGWMAAYRLKRSRASAKRFPKSMYPAVS